MKAKRRPAKNPKAKGRAYSALGLDPGDTPKQQVFVAEYLVTLNASEAAARAGYSPRSAHVMGCLLLKQPRIAAAIRDGMAARATRIGVAADQVVAELARVAFSDIGRVLDWDDRRVTLRELETLSAADRAAIAEISVLTPTRGSRRVRVRLHDKLGALALLMRHLGLDRAVAQRLGFVAPDPEGDRERLMTRLENLAKANAALEAERAARPPRSDAKRSRFTNPFARTIYKEGVSEPSCEGSPCPLPRQIPNPSLSLPPPAPPSAPSAAR